MNNGTASIITALLLLAPVAVSAAVADAGRQIVIALHTDEFDLPETDISHLAVGEAETIVSDSGKVIDLLRTQDGVEIYVDGELIDLASADHDGHAEHTEKVIVVKQRDEVE